jgi:kumamolisin
MKVPFNQIARVFAGLLFVSIAWMSILPTSCLSNTATAMVRLHDHIPKKAVAAAQRMGKEVANTEISMAITLPLRNQQVLTDLLNRIYDPSDPLYNHYLTPQEFINRFGPTQADYDAVATYTSELGFQITQTYSNRTLLDVSASAAAVESAFKLQLQKYQAPNGRQFYAPDNDPEVPDSIQSRVLGVIGLDNAAVWHGHSYFRSAAENTQYLPDEIGTGPGGGLAPDDIKTAYNLNEVAANGSGQALGLLEFCGYNSSDISVYTSYFGLPSVALENVIINGFFKDPRSNEPEATLDIELQIAIAPGASRIIVYEAPNSDTGVVDACNKMATDDRATQISISWGLSEGETSSIVLSSENTAFQQMAAQGQSVYAASGDNGAYDNGSSLSVDDPASQPYVVSTGGTKLFVNADGTYGNETTWNADGTVSGGASGGGVSCIWDIPSWQQGVASAASATMRNVPDVSLNADVNNGYSIYYNNKWWVFGGTSCAAPLWAAFTACVNQIRDENGMSALGFANPSIYSIAAEMESGGDFHDIADGSTNLYYVTGTGYDNATGWGSFNGANLLAELAQTAYLILPDLPTGLTALGGDGFVELSWTGSSNAMSYNIYRSKISGGEGTTPITDGITATIYIDNNVTNGVTYYYKVSATNSSGTSSLSNEASATPVAPPDPPTGLTATGGDGFISLSWTASSGVTSYNIYRGTASGGEGSASIATVLATTTYIDYNVIKRVTYYYKVSALNGSGTSSLSNEASAAIIVKSNDGGGCFINILK